MNYAFCKRAEPRSFLPNADSGLQGKAVYSMRLLDKEIVRSGHALVRRTHDRLLWNGKLYTLPVELRAGLEGVFRRSRRCKRAARSYLGYRGRF